jgi:hypothetical protein
MNYNSENSSELTAPELRCLARFYQLTHRAGLWSHGKHTLNLETFNAPLSDVHKLVENISLFSVNIIKVMN